MSATEINMSVDECFNILDGLLGTDGYIAITEAVKKLVKQNNELREENESKFEKGWQVGKEDCMSDADEEIDSLKAELKELQKTPRFPKSDEVVQIGSLLTTYSNVMKWKQSHKEVEELKEQNKELERAYDKVNSYLGEGAKKEREALQKKVAELEESVFNADSRCNQFRVKVGYSYIHDILTEIHDMDLDTYDNDEDDDDAGTLKCVEEFKGALFNECAGAINRIINHNISPEISQHIMEEIGNVVELFQRDGYIVEA